MSEPILVDAAAREAALTRLDDSICVEAGAGTGKTTVMVARIVNLIKRRAVPIGDIAAITFTEKAAGELRQRLRDRLEDELTEARSAQDRALVLALERSQRELGSATIGTIHSFASSILREFPSAAGIDPAFEQLDEIGRSQLIEDAWSEWLEEIVKQAPQSLADLLHLGGKINYLKELALHLCSMRHLDLQIPGPSEPVEPVWAAFLEHTAELARVSELCDDPADLAYVACGQFSALHSRLMELSGIERWRVLAESIPRFRSNSGKRGAWGSTANLDKCRSLLLECRDCASLAVSLVKQEVLMGIFELALGFVSYYTTLKLRKGVVDFDDLLLLARNVVRDDLEVRTLLQNRFRHILVDEFQDTDALQAEVVFFISELSPQAKSWKDVILCPGKLFIVGDPKQSIYRFRGADIEVYEHAKMVFSAQGTALSIVQNFRTVAPVIRWVNRSFGELIVKPEIGNFQPSYEGLTPFRELAEEAHRVWVVGDPSEISQDEGSSRTLMSAVRGVEARAIAATIKDLMSGTAGATVRPESFRYGDIAILFPNRSEIGVYEDALNSLSIPYAMDGGKSYYARQEVDYLISLLRAVANPRDEVSVVASLRSPHFGIPDDIILAYRAKSGRFDYRRPRLSEEALDPEISAAFQVLRRLHELRRTMSLARLIELALDETKALEVLMARRGGRQGVYNLLKVCDMARAYERSDSPTLSAFVDWLSDRRGSQVAEAESATSELSDDVVQLMTIHKSKGLEFPVVILANLGGEKRNNTSFVARTDIGTLEMRLGPKEGGFETRGFEQALVYDSEREAAEEIRLLYVAATRPKELLVIPNFSGKQGSSLARLQPFLELARPFEPTRWDTLLRLDASSRADAEVADPHTLRSVRDAWARELKSTLQKASAPRSTVKPSDHDLHPIHQDADVFEWPATSQASTGQGALLGTAFHSVMERLNPLYAHCSADDLARAANSVCSRLMCPELTEQVCTMAARCFEMEAFQGLTRSVNVYREVPFSTQVPASGAEDALCEGYMDAICEHADGTVTVVDYKTDNIREADVDRRFELYRQQGLLYGLAIECTMPGRLRDVIFLFVSPGVTRTISAREVREAMPTVRTPVPVAGS